MKAFKFQLESALVLREREEQAAREAYGRSLQALAFAQQDLTDAQTLLDELTASFAERRRRGFRASDQYVYWTSVQRRTKECESRRELMDKAAAEVSARCSAMLEARRRYETLVRLKAKRHEAHEVAWRHDEERTIDDIVNARYAKNRLEATL